MQFEPIQPTTTADTRRGAVYTAQWSIGRGCYRRELLHLCLSLPVLPSCPLSKAFPYPQPGDAGGRPSAPAVCQSLTSVDPTCVRVLN